jgi:lysophospholipase L1-like esterase
MRRILTILIILPVFLVVGENCGHYFISAAQSQDWEPAIRTFEEQDKVHPPKVGSIVFTGSSSIARWDTLVTEMKGLEVINRGFGGSQYSDLNHYANRIVMVYRPRAVVVYEGDNDLAAESSKTPESVSKDAQEFVRIVQSALPETWVYILSIKPSNARLNEWPKMKEANRMIQEFAGKQKRVQYIDVAAAMFDAEGKLRGDLLVEDGLHPNAKCYASWASIIKPILLERFGHGQSANRLDSLPLASAQSAFDVSSR